MVEPLVVYDRQTIRRRRLSRWLAALMLPVVILLALQSTGVLTFERHSGFHAPTWDLYAEQVFYIQRDTLGVVWRSLWKRNDEVLRSAHAWVVSDRISLRRLYLHDGRVEVLRQLDETPASGRVLQGQRGHVFGLLRAQINVRDGGLDFMARVALPDDGRMQQSTVDVAYPGGYSDNPLAGDIELLVAPGRESYPAAILAVNPDATYDVLMHNRYFDSLYPQGIPAVVLEQVSRRQQIAEQREVERQVAKLMRDYRDRGLSDAEIEQSLLEAGYIPVGTRLIASQIESPEPGEREFPISEAVLDSGQFKDIRAAIETPGKVVVRQTSDIPVHYGDDAAQSLLEWLATGNRSFVIRYRDRYYRLLLIH